jgi:hypothetical protein
MKSSLTLGVGLLVLTLTAGLAFGNASPPSRASTLPNGKHLKTSFVSARGVRTEVGKRWVGKRSGNKYKNRRHYRRHHLRANRGLFFGPPRSFAAFRTRGFVGGRVVGGPAFYGYGPAVFGSVPVFRTAPRTLILPYGSGPYDGFSLIGPPSLRVIILRQEAWLGTAPAYHHAYPLSPYGERLP